MDDHTRELVPGFILEHDPEQITSGTLAGGCFVLDVSGFTPLTQALMQHGDEGAELLSGIINEIFDPVITAIRAHGGFVSSFAGDACTAIFPEADGATVYAAAARARDEVLSRPLKQTPYGDFPIDAKVGIGAGAIHWGIVRGGKFNTYYVDGAAVAEAAAAQTRCPKGEIALGPGAAQYLPDAEADDDGFVVVSASAHTPAAATAASQPQRAAIESAELDKLQGSYIPLEELPLETPGEFRGVHSIFFSLQDPQDHDEIQHVAGQILDLTTDYGGYFNLLDYGDKGYVALALFGAPSSHGDDLTRATQLSLAVMAALGDRVRIGLAAGLAFAGYVGNRDRGTYTALGAPINLAARLALDAQYCSVVAAGEIIDRLGDRAGLTELYRRRFKGFSAELPVYAISSGGAEPLSEDPFVARPELQDRIRSAVDDMIDTERWAYYVVGEPGSGKSRLVRETLQSLPRTITSLTLTADTILRKSLNAVPGIIRSVFALAQIDLETHDMPAAMEALADWFIERGVSHKRTVGLREAESGLAAVLGSVSEDSLYARLDPQARFELTATAIGTLLTFLSAVTPTIIVIDNANALDADTRNVFSRIVAGEETKNFGMLFVGRGDAAQSVFGVEEHVDLERIIAVGGLAREEVAAMIGNVIQGPPDHTLVDFITHRVGNNALYVGELARYLRRRGLLERGEAGYRVVADDVSLPTGINELLMARIDSLPSKVRTAAQAAVVFGVEFEPELLSELIAASDDFTQTLAAGETAGLWLQTGTGSYRFGQELVRQTLVDMQLSATLKRMHERAAQIVARLRSDDPSMAANLAYHYTRAGMRTEAASALRSAADYALANFKNEKALEFLHDLRDYTDSPLAKITSYRDTASVYELTGKWQDAIDALTYAVGMSIVHGDGSQRARLLMNLGELYRKQSDLATAIRLLQQAHSLAAAREDRPVSAESLIYLGQSYTSRGEYETAHTHLSQAHDTSVAIGDKKLEGLALYYEGVVFRVQNKLAEAESNFTESYAIFTSLDDNRLATYPLYDLGVLKLNEGRLDEAQDYFEQSLHTYRQIGYLSGASAATLNLGVLRDRRGDFDAAITYYQESREMAERVNEQLAIGYTLFSIGATYYKMGDLRKSPVYLKNSFDIIKGLGIRGYYGYPLSYLVSVLARSGDGNRAVRIAHMHTRLVAEIGTDPENGRAVMSLGETIERGSRLSGESTDLLAEIAAHYQLADLTPPTFYRKAIEIAEPTTYVDTLVPSRLRLALYERSTGNEEQFRHHLAIAFTTALDAHWDRFVRSSVEKYEPILEELGLMEAVPDELRNR